MLPDPSEIDETLDALLHVDLVEANEEIDELTDAMIEDTVHCSFCGGTILCGDPDCLIGESGWCLCCDCAAEVAQAYQEARKEAGEP